jgi:hypothetical protein
MMLGSAKHIIPQILRISKAVPMFELDESNNIYELEVLAGTGSPARPLHPFRRHAMCVEPSLRTRSDIAG